jgi:DNA-binding NarL/FixJ family response regulator
MGLDRGRIFIAEADRRGRELLSGVFARAGYETRQSSSGDEVLRAAREERPALVILDVVLPGLSGLEVCRTLRVEFGELLPILFISGNRTEPLDRVIGLSMGADDYLVKPVDPEEMVARVRRCLVRSASAGSQGARPASRVYDLSPREHEILGLLADGLKQEEIANRLVISPNTVGTHIQRILAKMEVHSRTEAVALAYREGSVGQRRPGSGPLHRVVATDINA